MSLRMPIALYNRVKAEAKRNYQTLPAYVEQVLVAHIVSQGRKGAAK